MTSIPSDTEVIIVGAGIVGLSIAWQLHRRGQKNILVLEKGAGIGEGSTGASSAVCRYRYSAIEMIRLAQCGINSYRNWAEFVGLSEPLAHFHNDGVLWFTGDDLTWADRESDRMRSLGIRTEVLDSESLCRAFPAINPCIRPVDLADPEHHQCGEQGRHLLELDGGYMEPVDTAQDLLTACKQNGVEVRFGCGVNAILEHSGRVTGVRLVNGEQIDASVVVNAAGPWCNALYQSLGLSAPMPLTPVRIQVLYLNRNPELARPIPVTADIQSGIYFRTLNRGQQLLVGSVLEEDEREEVPNPDEYLKVADDRFRVEKLHLLAHRLSGLKINAATRDHCGLYTVNQTDVHPIIGALGPQGFFVANGFSGHGFKTGPAIGAMVARLITGIKLADEDAQDDHWLTPDRQPIDIDSRSVLA